MEDLNAIYVIISVAVGLLVGLPAGLGGGVMLLTRANQSAPLKDAIEHLAQSVPQETVKDINKGAQIAQETFKFFATQFSFANVPEPLKSVLKQAAEGGYQAATLAESVTDGESNNIPAPFQTIKGVPPNITA